MSNADYTPDRVQKVIDKIIMLQAEKEDIDEAIDNYKAKLAEMLGEGEHEESGRKVTVYHHKAINATYAKAHEPELYKKALVTTEVFNAAGAKKNLTEEEYARVQKVSPDFSVKVELLDD